MSEDNKIEDKSSGAKVLPLIERVKDHQAKTQMDSMLVPEWGINGNPLKVFYKPFTLGEQRKIDKLSKGEKFAILAYTVAVKALDENGNRLFDDAHGTEFLYKANSVVLMTIATRMVTSISNMADLVKNSEATLS